MKNIFILFVLLILPFSFLFAGNNFSVSDSAAIIQTALDYGDGFYSGDVVRMERALHPDFNKVSPMKISETGNTFLYYSTFSGLLEMTRAKVGFLDESKRNEKVTLLKINNDIGFAKITTALFCDYLEMIKLDGQWKIINVLWTNDPDAKGVKPNNDFNPEYEKEFITQAVSDLYEGIFTGDATKIDKSVHTEYNGVSLSVLPNNLTFINKNGFAMLREAARSKIQLLDKDKWNLQITILDIMAELAAVEVDLTSSIYYIQLAKMDGQWKIINSLKKSIK